MRNVLSALLTAAASTALFAGGLVSPACAQKGVGDLAGVARQATRPDVASLSGEVLKVETGPCETTTGRAGVGTHLLLEIPQAENQKAATLNVHLGPAAAVAFVADQLRAGDKVTVEAFRTEQMPENHYVAKSLTRDGKTIRLRDEALRPFWRQAAVGSRVRAGAPGRARAATSPAGNAGQAAPPAWGPCPRYGWERGRGAGFGRRAGWGRGHGAGPGLGRRAGYGRGGGWGPGAGYGRGLGRGLGRGAGWGRGRAFLDEDRDGICDNYQRIPGAARQGPARSPGTDEGGVE